MFRGFRRGFADTGSQDFEFNSGFAGFSVGRTSVFLGEGVVVEPNNFSK